MSYLMHKWHAAINDNIHKHVLFGCVFLMYISLFQLLNDLQHQRKAENWKAENIPTHSSLRPPG